MAKMASEDKNNIVLLYTYLSKSSIREIENGLHLYSCYSEKAIELRRNIHKPTKIMISNILEFSYKKPLKEYEFVLELFVESKLSPRGSVCVESLKKEMNIQ
ncbi:hypothetical protein RI056_00220 (plasmid) [Komagataeibacter nataicola]|nr:hypothetical protein [Komagataeibacter nataicola]WNM07301.1 hypothetical protein RI056_00220 [Komagataeibacter nataicola]